MLFWLLVGLFPFAMIYAAVSDVLTMTIGNRLCILLAIAFFPIAGLVGFDPQTIALHAATGALMLALGIALFATGAFGGGDAKLMAATALWFGPSLLIPYLVYTALFGAPLTLALLWSRAVVPPVTGIAFADRLLGEKTGIPYGVALAAGALAVYLDSPFMQAALSTP